MGPADLFIQRSPFLSSHLKQQLHDLSSPRSLDFLTRIQRGIEKESLRMRPDGKLAQTPHPRNIKRVIQSGLIAELSEVSAGGALGIVGISVVGQLGWLILLQTVGWMAGLKIAVFGIGGYGRCRHGSRQCGSRWRRGLTGIGSSR